MGFDVGGSSVKWGFGNCQQGLLCFESVAIKDKSLQGLQDIFDHILSEVDGDIKLKNIRGIGIGTPGTIDRASGNIVGINPNLPFWTGISPAILIDPQLKIPVVYDNDANLMCLGESSLLDGNLDIVGITIGSGIGSGYVQKGRIFHGSHGLGMEFGHITAVPSGEVCNCGRKGCLEAYASIEGIKSRAKKQLCYTDALAWNLKTLLRFAQEDSHLQRYIQEGEQLLARSLADLCVLLDPDLILLGGGGSEGGLYDIQKIDECLSQSLPSINRHYSALRAASLGNKAGVLGAIVLAQKQTV